MANEAARGDYDDIQESLKNTKINIRESLNKIDLRTSNKYDLRNLYDSCILTDKEKRTIAEMIARKTKANVLYEALMNKFEGKELEETKESEKKRKLPRKLKINIDDLLKKQFGKKFDDIVDDYVEHKYGSKPRGYMWEFDTEGNHGEHVISLDSIDWENLDESLKEDI
jgi:hypothetical protein